MTRTARTLDTKRLVLRRPRIDDADAIFRAYAADPEVTRYLPWTPHTSMTETRRFLRAFLDEGPEGRSRAWAIDLRPLCQ